jgi:hypothetical protein
MSFPSFRASKARHGIQGFQSLDPESRLINLDSRFRGNDGLKDIVNDRLIHHTSLRSDVFGLWSKEGEANA